MYASTRTPSTTIAATVHAAPAASSILCLSVNQPPGYELEYFWFDSCGDCQRAGEAGIARGDWQEYRCTGFPIGLDYVYPLYVR